jgi:4-hydroxythreonine-4-phosphate dehydrogenase
MTLPLAVTPGDPAGIGPDLVLEAARHHEDLAVFADPDTLRRRARLLGTEVTPIPWHPGDPLPRQGLPVIPVPLAMPETPGRPEPGHAPALLEALRTAVAAVEGGHCAALVTGPLSKEQVAAGCGRAFTGHTEYLAGIAGAGEPVMMLVGGGLRVALATTHLPLRAVPERLDRDGVAHTVVTTGRALLRDFGLDRPRLRVTGLNPHAGEGGHLGSEEGTVIGPALERARAHLPASVTVHGPVPGDTAFVPGPEEGTPDAIVAMYHDQGLAPLKQAAFGRAVNVTLGLPFVRTSVDHGTAYDLAGTGRAEAGSLREALELARTLAANRREAG